MVQAKKMNEEFFAKMQKELTATGEIIRARQEEKQGVLDEFDAESKRFFFGKISERALASSVKKTNKELHRLDVAIRTNITKFRNLANREMVLASAQAPIFYKATLSGIVSGNTKAKKKVVKRKKKVAKKAKKKAVKKKVKRKASKKILPNIRKILKKEKKLDRKFSKKK